MKRLLYSLATLTLLVTCTPDKTNSSNGNTGDNTIHVTGISIDRPSAIIKEGESVTLTATVTPDNATNKAIIWTTSNEAVASVDNNGKVTGIKAGNATITATAEDGGKKAACALTVESNLAPSVTVGTDHISPLSAVLKGKANLGLTVASDLKVGFQYSKSAGILPSNSITVEAADADANYNYTTAIKGLDPETQYYFRSFARQNGQDTYGETKEFATNALSEILETLDADDIQATNSTLKGKADLSEVKYAYKAISHGFVWGTSEIIQNAMLDGGEIKDNVFSSTLTGLSHKTQYWYKAYVMLDDQTIYGEIKTFTTDVVPVESVTLSETEFTFNTIGGTRKLYATIYPYDATNKKVEWSSDNNSVATVNQDGVVTAKGNGKAIITVKSKDQGKSATCAITVAQLITSISLNKSSLTLNEGEEEKLTPTINPSNANNKSITWTSSNESVATVNANGKVTAVSKGVATIKASANDNSGKYASCTVTVKRLVSSISLDLTSLVMNRGASNVTETLSATIIPHDANNTAVTWTSSNSSVAAVSNSGIVTGKSRGNAIITVSANDGSGVKATCQVEVKQLVTNIALNKTSLYLEEGEEIELTTTISPSNANNTTLTWTSSDESVAFVDYFGKVTAISKGTTTIMATSNDGSGKSASCAVTVSRLVSSIVLSKTSVVLYRSNGDVTETITATVYPSTANNTDITWSSSNTSVATVSSTGVITGQTRGYATITATADDGSGIKATCEVEVSQYVTDLALDKTSLYLEEGEEIELTTTISPSNANNTTLTWTSSDESVAFVNQYGKVSAKTRGDATITATSSDGSDVSVSCDISVCPVGAIDMGLKTSSGKKLYWAKYNLADAGFVPSPDEYGAYYAWGETKTKYRFNWSSYKWCNGSYDTLTKYNTMSSYGEVDNKTVLETGTNGDDVASKILGDKWRLPTEDECTALRNKCTRRWISQNGVKGLLITASNGNSIFLPAAGFWLETSLYDSTTYGCYITSSLKMDKPDYAVGMSFDSKTFTIGSAIRYAGHSVRPVTE